MGRRLNPPDPESPAFQAGEEVKDAKTDGHQAKSGIYAGSFDPPTFGHLYMIEEGSRLFDRLVVAIGINPDKRYSFSLTERRTWLEALATRCPNVEVDDFENQYLIHFAASRGIRYILRGIRNANDYEFERTMRYVNADIDASITTVFLVPPREIAEVSSSFVKGLVGPNGWEDLVTRYLPPEVQPLFLQRFGRGLS